MSKLTGAPSYKFAELCDYLTDCDENQNQLNNGMYIDPETKQESALDDEKRRLLIFEIYDNLEQLDKHIVKIQTAMRQKFKFTKKQVEEYFADDED